MSVSQKAKAAYDKYKQVKKAKDYFSSAQKLLDEDTRDGELFRQGVKAMTKLGEKLVGQSIGKHPYFKYHKVHLELLASALDASAKQGKALEALRAAIEAADTTEALARQIDDLVHRKNALKLAYAVTLQPFLQTRQDLDAGNAETLRELAAGGGSRAGLTARIDANVYEFRALVADLYFDAADLHVMVDIEARAAAEAYRRYSEKVRKMQESKSALDRIAGQRAEYNRQLEWAERELDRAFNRSGNTPDPMAVQDPSLHARRQRDKVAAVLQALETLCDTAMGEALLDPAKFRLRAGTL
jgi:hypothetical protein